MGSKDGDNMNDVYKIKERLKEAMMLRDMSISELARVSGLNKSTVSRYLSGQVIPRSNAIGAMANALSVSPAWVLGYDVNIKGEVLQPEIEMYKLNQENQARLMAYYQALIDSQGGSNDADT